MVVVQQCGVWALGRPGGDVQRRRSPAAPVVVRTAGRPRRRLPHPRRTPAPRPPRPPAAPPHRPAPGLRRLGRGHRPDVRHRPLHGPRARSPRPQPRPRRPRPRQAPRHRRRPLRRRPRHRADQDRGVRLRARRHPRGRRGAAAAEEDGGGAGRGRAGEQRRRGHAVRGVPARGRRGGVGAHGAGEYVGTDAGDRRGAARDGGAAAGRRRQHRLRLQRGSPVVPALLRLLRLQTVHCPVLQEPVRRVQKQRDRRAVPDTTVRGDEDDVGHSGLPRPRGGDAGRLCPRGGALDRPWQPTLHAQPHPSAPVLVRRPRRAGLHPQHVVPPRESQSEGPDDEQRPAICQPANKVPS